MRLHNHTNLRAGLFRGEPHQEHMLATMVVHVDHGILVEERIVRLHYRAALRYAVVRHVRRDAILEVA
jgi:hypothetical protein